MRTALALLAALAFAGCVTTTTKIEPTDGGLAAWTQHSRAFGPAKIHQSAQDFKGEVVYKDGKLTVKLRSGQDLTDVSTEITPDMLSAIVKALTALGIAP